MIDLHVSITEIAFLILCVFSFVDILFLIKYIGCEDRDIVPSSSKSNISVHSNGPAPHPHAPGMDEGMEGQPEQHDEEIETPVTYGETYGEGTIHGDEDESDNRNFNQFVNRYRIEEAGERLLSEARTPVLTIALDVGFRSISSFNTAFQAQFGVSPTQYRAQALSNS